MKHISYILNNYEFFGYVVEECLETSKKYEISISNSLAEIYFPLKRKICNSSNNKILLPATVHI